MSKRKPYSFAPLPSESRPAWRSLDDKHNPEAAVARAATEFTQDQVSGFIDAGSLVTRRGFLTLSSASAALAAAGCVRRPEEPIHPFSRAPEYVIPGVALHFATAREVLGDVEPLLVTSHEGRPTKVEGNPAHSWSRGKSTVAAQASVWNLYDPDRATKPTHGTGRTPASVAVLEDALQTRMAEHAANGGEGLRLLVAPTSSPSRRRLLAEFAAKYPNARVHTYAPVSNWNAVEGARLAFGRPVHAEVEYGDAKVVVSIDADFLHSEPGALRAAYGFADGRRLRSGEFDMNRLYVVESTFSLTGGKADHRLRLRPSAMGAYLRALAAKLAELGAGFGAAAASLKGAAPEGVPAHWIDAVARDLWASQGKGAVVVGLRQPPAVHALAHAINVALGNTGKTVRLYDAPEALTVDPVRDIAELAADAAAGKVKSLFILDGNPVYDAPSDVDFAAALAKVEFSLHLSSHVDETAAAVTWHLPKAHYLESWGDLRGADGRVAIVQPLIAPLYEAAKSSLEVLVRLTHGAEAKPAHAVVRATVAALAGGSQDESAWRASLQQGFVQGIPARVHEAFALSEAGVAEAASAIAAPATGIEVVFAPCPKLGDGADANNPWLLEVPETITKVVWDNVALVSPKTARALGVKGDAKRADLVKVSAPGAKEIQTVVWEVPGHPDDVVTLWLGWGRQFSGKGSARYGHGQGFNAYPLRTTKGFWSASGAAVKGTGATYFVAQTQDHGSMEGRAIVLESTLSGYEKNPEFARFRSVEMSVPPLWKQAEYNGHKWGMSIDLTACTGCNACVIACQAENNIPNVGKRQVARGREMYWLRIDRYFVGSEESPDIALQPIGCQQCEEAPCENVCPVNATAHSPEGLNDMSYNRCIGTRYCMNNCPYKVRRFNFLAWHGRLATGEVAAEGGSPALTPMYGDGVPETEKMAMNPNVTVRMRGVMEKCTYCVQRIQEGKIRARREGRRDDKGLEKLRDGEVVSACAQACPSDAIVFGDLNDPRSRVAALHELDRRYKLLAEVGTQPRTAFLAQIRNPNPEMNS